jgi:DNA-binding PadR family transcriptional regulator
MLDLAILGLLHDGPVHGYELKRLLTELDSWKVSFGSLYPALRRLEKHGHVTVERSGGRRKVYALTSDGKDHFHEMLEAGAVDAEDERAFQLRLAFFRHLEPDARIDVLESRRASLTQRRAATRTALRKAGSRARERMDRYTLALMERGMRSAEADIAWIDDLIATERDEQEGLTADRRPDQTTGGASDALDQSPLEEDPE